MKCKDCPARGKEHPDMCFASCKPTIKISEDDDCKYGIEDYDQYWLEKTETKK